MDPIHPRITQIISMPTSPRFHAPLHPLHSASFNSCQPPMTEALCRTLLALCHTLLTLCHTLCTLSHSWHFVTLLALCHTLGTLSHSWHFVTLFALCHLLGTSYGVVSSNLTNLGSTLPWHLKHSTPFSWCG